MKKKVTVEDALEKISELMRKNNPGGGGKLNAVVIGESESAQGTSIKGKKLYPRIMLKSPNSELMVTYNTDPSAKGYNTIEIMRWNGKKGRYDFQEMDFGEKGNKPHVDLTGKSCLECHKAPSPRPNWDTYRAWAGVVPSRDDMLEMHAKDGEFQKSLGLQPDAKAYFNFIEQVAKDKDAKKKSRLSILDIPYDPVQLGSVVPKGKVLNNVEKVAAIKKRVETEGFYRIKHFPDVNEGVDKGLSFNFDAKTAVLAGPSQFAFDQMLSQNMCRVAQDLKAHPNFDKFKSSLALTLLCGQSSEFFPQDHKNRVMAHYNDSKFKTLSELTAKEKPTSPITDFVDVHNLVLKDTENNHNRSDKYKFSRHKKFLKKYYKNIENRTDKDSNTLSTYYSESVVSPTMDDYHAFTDEGGVKGVPEGSTEDITDVRLLLEPFGVKVNHWSLVNGKGNAYNSLSFSDQFDLLKEQKVIKDVLKDAGGTCAKLEQQAVKELESLGSFKAPKVVNKKATEDEVYGNMEFFCSSLAVASIMPVSLGYLVAPTVLASEDQKKSLKKCVECHNDKSLTPFEGLEKFV